MQLLFRHGLNYLLDIIISCSLTWKGKYIIINVEGHVSVLLQIQIQSWKTEIKTPSNMLFNSFNQNSAHLWKQQIESKSNSTQS